MLNALKSQASSYETATQRFAGLTGIRYGSGDGRPPLVFLHGLTWDCTMWAPALQELSKIAPQREVLALNLPGHGDSPRRDSYALADVVEQVHGAVTAAGIGSPAIVGHSVSGVVATVYAANHPTAHVVNVDQALVVKPFAEAMRNAVAHGADYEHLWEFNKSLMGIETLPAPAQRLLETASTPRLDLLAGYWGDLAEQTPDDLQEWIDVTARRVAARGVPYTIVTGSAPDAAYAAWLRQTMPDAKIVVFDSGTHLPHLASPKRFAGIVAAT